ncbi:MAG: hypothetical protein AAGA74_13860, partial [Pseudomonadota bacterium]
VELGDAVITNPFSHRSMDHAIQQALEMDAPEQRARMVRLRAAVRASDVRGWKPDLIAGGTNGPTLHAAE